MKKLLLSILLAVPFLANAQVQSPGTAESTPQLITRTGWTVTANSGVGADGAYVNLFDGNAATYWNSDYNNVGTNTYPHILTTNMQSNQNYNGVMITPRSGARVPSSITFRKSSDGVAWTNIATVVPQNVNKAQYFSFPSLQSSQYLQVELTSSYNVADVNAELAEIAPFTNLVVDNTAYSRVGWVATGSDTQGTGGAGDDGGYAATLDSDPLTYWHSQYSPQAELPHYLEVDMLSVLKMNKISLINRSGNTAGRFTSFTVSYKVNSGDSWTLIPGTFSSPLAGPAINNIPLGTSINARYIRLDITAVGSGKNAMLAEFRAHNDVTLPVSLTDFTAKANGGQVNLTWKTSSEQNSNYFQVLRSADGVSFNAIGGQVKAAGNSNSILTYHLTDFSPLKGDNYYKLNQYDKDGALNPLAKIATAKIALPETSLTILSTSSTGVEVNIYAVKATVGTLTASNVTGQKVGSVSVKLTEGYNKYTVPANTGNGVVIVTLKTAEGTISKKAIK